MSLGGRIICVKHKGEGEHGYCFQHPINNTFELNYSPESHDQIKTSVWLAYLCSNPAFLHFKNEGCQWVCLISNRYTLVWSIWKSISFRVRRKQFGPRSNNPTPESIKKIAYKPGIGGHTNKPSIWAKARSLWVWGQPGCNSKIRPQKSQWTRKVDKEKGREGRRKERQEVYQKRGGNEVG